MLKVSTDRDKHPFWLLDFIGDTLNPDKFVPMFRSIQAGRPVIKGSPIGRSTQPTAKVATTSIYLSWTAEHIDTADPNDHLAFLLDAIEPRIVVIQRIMIADELIWKPTLLDMSGSTHISPPWNQQLVPAPTCLLYRYEPSAKPLSCRAPRVSNLSLAYKLILDRRPS